MTNEQALKWVTERIDALALKFNATSEQMWEILKRQAYVDSIVGLISIIFCFLVLTILLRIIIWAFKTEKGREVQGTTSIIFFVAFFILFIANLANINDIVTGFYNPDYLVIKSIFKLLK